MWPVTDEELQALAAALAEVPGVRAVVLGGSRARGDHTPESDHDLGLYYESSPDLEALRALALDLSCPSATVSAPGDWGPWVDGGGWLRIGDADVDWIYRDLARVRLAWRDAREGRFAYHVQVGHPLGFPDFAYVGEVALGVVLVDSSGELRSLQAAARDYPPALAEALVDGLWEADFLLANAAKAVTRADAAFVAGCLFRVVGLCVHALHGRAGAWVVHEKGAVTSAARLAVAPPDFGPRAHALLAHVGRDPDRLASTLGVARELVADTRAACGVG